MMAHYNFVSILGRVESEPVAKTLPTGTTLNEFVFAWEDSYASKAGAKVVNKFTIDVTLLDFLAKKLESPLKTGDEIILEGHLRSNTWGAEGAKRTKHSITASNIVLMDSTRDKTERVAPSTLETVKKVYPNATVKTVKDIKNDGVNFVDELPF